MTLLIAADRMDKLLIAAVTAVLSFLAGRYLQTRQFRHQQRFEREYPINLRLVEELINLRRALHDLAGDLGPFVEGARDKVEECFNKFKDTVVNNEPVLHSSVFTPARDIVSLAREIVGNMDKIRSINEGHPPSARGHSIETDEQHANELIRLDNENETSIEEIDRLFEVTKRAINNRVRP